MIDKHKGAIMRVRKIICHSLLRCDEHERMATKIVEIILDEQKREREICAAAALDRLAAEYGRKAA